jgi:hypothetical protein
MSPRKSKRKFYRTVFRIEVLSEYPYPDDIENLHYNITEGDCSGKWEMTQEVLNGQQAADALRAQGSAPEFFRLDEMGVDLD